MLTYKLHAHGHGMRRGCCARAVIKKMAKVQIKEAAPKPGDVINHSRPCGWFCLEVEVRGLVVLGFVKLLCFVRMKMTFTLCVSAGGCVNVSDFVLAIVLPLSFRVYYVFGKDDERICVTELTVEFFFPESDPQRKCPDVLRFFLSYFLTLDCFLLFIPGLSSMGYSHDMLPKE